MLPPGQQLWLDVGRLIHDQIQDSNGNTLAPDTMVGSYELRDLDHQTVGQLYEGKLVIDKTYGHAAYGCGTCCGYGIPKLLPDPFSGLPGINNDNVMQSVEQCGGDTVDLADDAYDWNSSNTTVATLPTKTLHTVATGSATGNATVYVQADKPAPRCPMAYYSPQQPVTVAPDPPDHLVVQSDTTQVVCTTNGTVRRDITYSEVDASGNSVGTISTEEQFASKGTNTCNTTISTSQTCSPDVGGILTDHIGVGCNSVGGNCGVTFTKQQWLYCPSSGSPVPFATPGDLVIHNSTVTVGGYSSFPAGTKINVSGIILP